MSLKNEELNYPAANGKDKITAQIWYDDDVKSRCVLQIVHGMCEYMGRYEDFAGFMAKNGVIVCGHDIVGHGKSKGADGYGYFGDKNGDADLVEDTRAFNQIIAKRYPELDIVMLGHSMGSFICRDYITRYGDELAGIILSGTSGDNPLLGMARFLAGTIKLFRGKKYRSPLLTKLAFGSYNDRYPEKRTIYDWISRDTAIVDKYAADERCTFKFTAGAYGDMLKLFKRISGDGWAQKVPKNKPYYFLSGAMDPVGGYTEGVKQIYNRLKDAGISDVTLRLYDGGHHEMLNEINRKDVYQDLLDWINNIVASKEPAAVGEK
jgi:alpha-beta hydrolase superfamily lysophospholipase